jgi:hypothetical protein
MAKEQAKIETIVIRNHVRGKADVTFAASGAFLIINS